MVGRLHTFPQLLLMAFTTVPGSTLLQNRWRARRRRPAAVQKRLLRQRLVCCVAQAQADVLLSRLHLCLPGWRAAEGRRRRAEQQFDWQEAARARGLAWDARGTDSSDFDEPQGAHRHH